MPFADINDPRGLCKDVTGLGRWGNGDVEVSFTSLEELPNIMGLVRQSFERQMGNGGEL
jgi:predicted transport protein